MQQEYFNYSSIFLRNALKGTEVCKKAIRGFPDIALLALEVSN